MLPGRSLQLSQPMRHNARFLRTAFARGLVQRTTGGLAHSAVFLSVDFLSERAAS